MADKANSLLSVGRAAAARELLDDWRRRKPQEFARGWRPAVFYIEAVEVGEITEGAIRAVETAIEDVVGRMAHEPKIWSKYARFERDLGRMERAHDIARRGLEQNPFSQELNYVLGDSLLRSGHAGEATEALERALNVDYQESYQHDVNQFSIRAKLAQAYEATGDTEKAKGMYLSVLATKGGDDDPGAVYFIKQYSRNRLSAILAREPDQLMSAITHLASEAADGKAQPASDDDAP
jgi:predicted Zn-dependent protease